MDKLSNPWIWLKRFRHRCGYGVHSPFAFRFITEVIYERSAYYAYSELDATLTFGQRWRIRRLLHLLLRLSNRVQPSQIVLPTPCSQAARYLQAGCKQAVIGEHTTGLEPALYYLNEPADGIVSHLKADSVLVIDHLKAHRKWFENLPYTVAFDLYDLGIAFFDPKYNRQYYIVNL